jgi:hypothetical protein
LRGSVQVRSVVEAWRDVVERSRRDIDGLRIELVPPSGESLTIVSRVDLDHASLGGDGNVTMGGWMNTTTVDYQRIRWRRTVSCSRRELRPIVRAFKALGFNERLRLRERPFWGVGMVLISASMGVPVRNPPLAHLRRWYRSYRRFGRGWCEADIRRTLRRLRRNELARMYRRWAGIAEHPWSRLIVDVHVDSQACYHAGTVYFRRGDQVDGADVVAMAKVSPEPELWQCPACHDHTLVWPGVLGPRCSRCQWHFDDDLKRG